MKPVLLFLIIFIFNSLQNRPQIKQIRALRNSIESKVIKPRKLKVSLSFDPFSDDKESREDSQLYYLQVLKRIEDDKSNLKKLRTLIAQLVPKINETKNNFMIQIQDVDQSLEARMQRSSI